MPTGQQYGTNVPQAQLSVGIGTSTTAFAVNSLSGWPATPFTAVLDIGQANQEPIDVLTVSGNSITLCTRNIDGTTAFNHAANATLTHADIGRDFRESRSHMDASSTPDAVGHSVHGLTSGSSVMGTSDVQTVINKTFGAGTAFTSNVNMGSGTWSGTGSLQEATLAFSGLTGATSQTSRIVGTINGTAGPTSGAFLLGDMVYDLTYRTLWVCITAGSPGTWVPLGGSITTRVTNTTLPISVPSWARTVTVNWIARSAGTGTGGDDLQLQLNGDTGANYIWQLLLGNGSSAVSSSPGVAVTSMRVGVIPAGGDTANYWVTGQLTFFIGSGSALQPVTSFFTSPSSATNIFTGTSGGQWLSSTAPNSINFVTFSGQALASGTAFAATFTP